MLPIQNTVTKLPLRSSNGFAPVEILPLTGNHIAYWEREVQPLVDSLYHASSPGDDEFHVRADVGWKWHHIHALAIAHNTVQLLRGTLGGTATGLALRMNGQSVGMMVYVPRFGCRLHGQLSVRTFIWYVSAAPPEFFWRKHWAEPKCITIALIDAAIQNGVNQANSDGLLLRADPQGGAHLRRFYKDRCGMHTLGSTHHAISWLRRSHSEDYFLLDRDEAREFSSHLAHLR